jgi:hypothetical protein
MQLIELLITRQFLDRQAQQQTEFLVLSYSVQKAHELDCANLSLENPKRKIVAESVELLIRSPPKSSCTVMPNPSLKLTRYGRRCKPGLSQSYYRLSPGLQHLPPRAA